MNCMSFSSKMIISLPVLLVSLSTFAAPQIDSIGGSFEIGSTLTIKGRGFSSSGTPPALYDSIDNQPVVSDLSDGAVVPEDQGPWTHNTNIWGNPVTVERDGDLRYQGSSAVYYGSVKSYLGWPVALEDQANKQLYVSWWYKPNQTVNNGGSNKFVRVWDKSDGTGTRVSLTQMHMIYDVVDQDYSPPTSWATTQPKANEWNRLEIYLDSDAGTIETWLNGNTIHKVNDFRKSNTSEGLNVGLVGFDPSINDNYSNLNFRMKDIYVSTSRSRVELSNSETWDPTSHREVLNANSWSDTEVNVDFSLFGHPSLSDLYIYIIDPNGGVNSQGYPVCDKCPEQPGDVIIQ